MKDGQVMSGDHKPLDQFSLSRSGMMIVSCRVRPDLPSSWISVWVHPCCCRDVFGFPNGASEPEINAALQTGRDAQGRSASVLMYAVRPIDPT